MLKALILLFAIVSVADEVCAQKTSSVAWDDPKLALHVPQAILQKFRNPDGCLSPDSPVDTNCGPIRIDSLDPSRHAICYHAKDGTIRQTNRYRAFVTKRASKFRRLGSALLTPEHRVAVSRTGGLIDRDRFSNAMPQYAWVEADQLLLVACELPTTDVWDIENYETCYCDEGNFFAGGHLVHNSCVQCSNGMTGTDQNVPEFAHLLWDSEYGKKVRGGSNPSRVANYAKERSVRIFNVTGQPTFDYMRKACKSGRGAAIGAASAHFQTLVGYDDKGTPDHGDDRWYVVNNNGDQHIQEYSDEAFTSLHLASGRWCVILDYAPAPAPGKVREWWK